MTADEELGYVYIPLTAPTASAWGGWRPGDNLFADSLVALDAKTGKRVWHFQTVHHDLWEWENVGPAMLGDITVDGRRIKAVMQPNKNGFLFVLDRTNGKPVWPIEERPVPQSTVPGEHTSPTQPFPTKPPAVRSPGRHRRRSDRLHAGAEGAGARDRQGLRHRPDVHAAVDHHRGTGHQQRHADAAWLVGRGELEHRRLRSRNRDVLRAVRVASRSVESRDQEDDQSGSDDGIRERGHVPRHRRPADHQGTVRPHHRVQSQHRHAGRGWSPTATARAIIRC